jgi:hypothetical protein
MGGALWAGEAQAKCASQALWTWPAAGAPLPPNGVILVTGYGGDQARVQALADLKPVLRGEGGEVVPLEVVEARAGRGGESKALLRPARMLSPGGTYQLGFEVEAPAHWDRALSEARWSVGATPDKDPPVWSGAPTFLGGNVEQFGCGPAVHAYVEAPVRDASALPLLIDVTLTAPDGQVERMWVEATAAGGKLALGHGMCSGDFSMTAASYEATFTALDAAGNATPAPGGPLTVPRP